MNSSSNHWSVLLVISSKHSTVMVYNEKVVLTVCCLIQQVLCLQSRIKGSVALAGALVPLVQSKELTSSRSSI